MGGWLSGAPGATSLIAVIADEAFNLLHSVRVSQ